MSGARGAIGLPSGFGGDAAKPGRLICVITPLGFEGFFEEIGALSAQQQDIPRVIELGRKCGLEFPPPPGA